MALFRYVSDPAYEISYGTEENPDTDTAETEELTEEQTTDTTETEQISETEETADADSTDEDTTEAESETVTETEEVSEEESVTEESSDTESETAEPPVVYDNVFTEWDDSVINTFSSLKQTDLQLKTTV